MQCGIMQRMPLLMTLAGIVAVSQLRICCRSSRSPIRPICSPCSLKTRSFTCCCPSCIFLSCVLFLLAGYSTLFSNALQPERMTFLEASFCLSPESSDRCKLVSSIWLAVPSWRL